MEEKIISQNDNILPPLSPAQPIPPPEPEPPGRPVYCGPS